MDNTRQRATVSVFLGSFQSIDCIVVTLNISVASARPQIDQASKVASLTGQVKSTNYLAAVQILFRPSKDEQ